MGNVHCHVVASIRSNLAESLRQQLKVPATATLAISAAPLNLKQIPPKVFCGNKSMETFSFCLITSLFTGFRNSIFCSY
jgi:hypothetical protein